MTNTYDDDAEPHIKVCEELRLIRCVLERKLMVEHPEEFVDYQMEKFGKAYKTTEGKK